MWCGLVVVGEVDDDEEEDVVFLFSHTQTKPKHTNCNRYTNYLDWSLYHYQLSRWLEHFPIDQFHFVDFRDLKEPDSIDATLDGVSNVVCFLLFHLTLLPRG